VHRVGLASICDAVLALQLQIISGVFCLGKEIASKTEMRKLPCKTKLGTKLQERLRKRGILLKHYKVDFNSC
jgi:hypothetical protein